MRKLGLPDLCVNQFASNRTKQVLGLLEQALQAVADQRELLPGGLLQIGTSLVPAVVAARQEGDAENQLLQLVVTDELLDLFGKVEEVVNAKDDDPELEAASQRARARLPEQKARFAATIAEGSEFLVKVRFSENGRDEYMWVKVQHWDGTVLEGVMTDTPVVVSKPVAGDRITVQERDVFDWVRFSPGGGVDGNETTKVLQQREQ
jgi:uncharacterized protein YegJ (DUF2314 family)